MRFFVTGMTLLAGIVVGATFSVALATTWVGPTLAPPAGNVTAPVNIGSGTQNKAGALSVTALAVFGDSVLSGLVAGTGRYLNFDYTAGGTSGTGATGYGIRDNAGTLEFKNVGGVWNSLTNLMSAYLSGGTVSSIKFSDGTTQTTAAASLPVFTSRYGSGRRCAGDTWISACGYMPGSSWQYNVCYSRGHAAYYGWTVVWHPEAQGYQLAGYLAGEPQDIVCDI